MAETKGVWGPGRWGSMWIFVIFLILILLIVAIN